MDYRLDAADNDGVFLGSGCSAIDGGEPQWRK